MGINLEEKNVIEILNSLEFEVECNKEEYKVTVPTYRTTKDISIDRDIIEEIARIYGFDKLTPVPLKLDLVVTNGEGKYELEYNIKKYIAQNTQYHEIHTYLWYKNSLLKKYKINKEKNVKIIGKNDNNIIRDDISWSLYEQCIENSKHTKEYGIFEIGSNITKKKEERVLSILNVCNQKNVENNYNKIRKLIYNLTYSLKRQKITYKKSIIDKIYIDNNYSNSIMLGNKKIGYISLLKTEYSKECGKKTYIINCELWIEKLYEIDQKQIDYKEPFKYPITNIDYTFILDKDKSYETLDEIIKKYKHKYLISYKFIDIYYDNKTKKVTLTFLIGSKNKTLEKSEIEDFQQDILKYIYENDLKIVEN